MKSLDKTTLVMIRLTVEQRRKLRAAAEAESRRRGERIRPATLAREMVMRAAEQLLAPSSEAA